MKSDTRGLTTRSSQRDDQHDARDDNVVNEDVDPESWLEFAMVNCRRDIDIADSIGA